MAPGPDLWFSILRQTEAGRLQLEMSGSGRFGFPGSAVRLERAHLVAAVCQAVGINR